MGNYNYKRLNLAERNAIEEELCKRNSARKIAKMLKRSPSAITEEVKRNRTIRSWTKKGQRVTNLPKKICPQIQKWPYVCNGCPKIGISCGYGFKTEYSSVRADKLAHDMWCQSREGVNMTQEEFEKTVNKIRKDITKRNLSPYQCSVTCKDFTISPSTIYRWIDNGYAGMSNMDLRKKLKYKPRKTNPERISTSHGIKYSYAEFCKLSQDERDSAVEMDTVIGRKFDSRCILTLYLRVCKFQFAILLNKKTVEEVKNKLDFVEATAGKDLFKKIFRLFLTDNGTEFSNPKLLRLSCLAGTKYRFNIFFCDVRASDQKAGCEKNHVELRKLLPKGENLVFDELDQWDMAELMSQVNSQPRKSLGGLSPISLFKKIYGREGEEFLEKLGVEELKPDELDLSINALNKERNKRNLKNIPIKKNKK